MSKPLKLYTDGHIPKQVAIQLRNRGVDIVRCEEVGLKNASDVDHLTFAAHEGRALISIDRDFEDHYWQWLAQGKPHAGIFKIANTLQGKGSIGHIVMALFEYHQLIEIGAGTVEADIQNAIILIK